MNVRAVASNAVDHWISNQIVARFDLAPRVLGWMARLAHWAGWHNLAFYAPEDEVVGVTFGTPDYVDEVVDYHEAMSALPEQERLDILRRFEDGEGGDDDGPVAA